ncbi:MAG: nitric oxide synthase [Candidatus Thorarchaeota archaeon]|nr:nitric oxide synthase [Candidatus Thorarchaeota archaeon]
MVKALIIYGTRNGATADTSELIAESLRQEGFEVKVINAKNEKIQSVDEYELVIVGSGIQMGRWTNESEKYLENFQQELSQRKLAIFVSSGAAHPLSEGEEKTREIQDARTNYLEQKAAKYNQKPIALGLFGGVYDFNKMSWILRRTMSSLKPQLEEAGLKETEPGRYDTRDFDAIHSWAKKVAQLTSI